LEQQSEQPVQTPEVARSPDAPDIAAPAAAPRLGGLAAALGNQAFGAWVSRAPVATPAPVSLGHPVLARDDKPIVTDRHRALIRSLIINPLDTAGDALDANPNKAMQTSILRRLRAARGAFRSLRFPPESTPGMRMADGGSRLDVAIGLLEAKLSKRPDQLLRYHWNRTLALCQGLSRTLPKPNTGPTPEPDDKRALMRGTVCPAVAAAIGDIPLIIADDATGEQMLQLAQQHEGVMEQIATVAGERGRPAVVEFMTGIAMIKMFAKPENEQMAFIAAWVDRAAHEAENLEVEQSEDANLPEPGEPPADESQDPSNTPTPAPVDPNNPGPAPSPNPLPPPPPPPPGGGTNTPAPAPTSGDGGAPPPTPAPGDAGVPPVPAGVP
jgi:hypothetical protein